MLECGFCASHLTRRSWHSGSAYHKVIWQCVTATKEGKKYCKCSKGIHEEIIEQAFLESYRLLCYNNRDVIDEMLERIELSLCPGDYAKEKSQVEMSIAALEKKRNKLLDMKLDELIDLQTYEEKNAELIAKLGNLNDELAMYANTESREKNIKRRLADFRKVLEHNDTLVDFDRSVFESIIDKVIVGGYDDDGNPNPSMLTFIYKTGFTNNVDSSKHKTPRKNSKIDKTDINAKLRSFTNNGENNLCLNNSDNACGDGMRFVQTSLGPTYRGGTEYG